jgi:hypothetical protein
MMKFHPPSFALGVGTAVVVMGAKKHLRPVVVELAALGVHIGRLGLSLVERQREHAEDLWAEVAARVRRRGEAAAGSAARGGNGAAPPRKEALS